MPKLRPQNGRAYQKSAWVCLSRRSPSQPSQQPSDVVSQRSDDLGIGPDPSQLQGIDRQAVESGQDLDAVVLPVPDFESALFAQELCGCGQVMAVGSGCFH